MERGVTGVDDVLRWIDVITPLSSNPGFVRAISETRDLATSLLDAKTMDGETIYITVHELMDRVTRLYRSGIVACMDVEKRRAIDQLRTKVATTLRFFLDAIGVTPVHGHHLSDGIA